MKFDHTKVKSARDLGPLFTKNSVEMIGQDCAYSVPINEKETFWGFGDTFIGKIDETGRRNVKQMPSNTGMICRTKDASQGLHDFSYLTGKNKQLRQLIPFEGNEGPSLHRIWGMDGCRLNDKLYWFYFRVRLHKHGMWPYKFSVDGSGLAVTDLPEFNFKRLRSGGSPLFWKENTPCFGVATFSDEVQEFVYIYGTHQRGKKQLCYLARISCSEIENLDHYEYLSGPGPTWSSEPANACIIMEGMPTEMTVSFNSYLEKYLAVHSWQNDGYIVGRTAPHPWGPWSDPFLLWVSKTPLRNPLVYNGPVVYAGKEHSELARENGKIIYLTCVEFEEYYPRLIEVTLN